MYTDFLDNLINPGDEIVYAQQAYGGGADLHRATIEKIIPLVPHPVSKSSYAREDQLGQRNPTKFYGDIYKDPAKRFKVQVMRDKYRHWREADGGWGSGDVPTIYTIPCSNSIIRVP